jgi:polysaccharide pyruvyl transferase WcaK-like protein
MRLVAPWGIFGSGNIGDEAMLKGFASLVKSYPHFLSIRIASQNPAHVTTVEPTFCYYHQNGRSLSKLWTMWRSEGQLIVGDTPINDRLGSWPLEDLSRLVEAARSRKQSVAFIGVGTEPLHEERSKRIMRETLAPSVTHWSVRSTRDYVRLQEYGVDPARISVACDLAWLLKPVDSAFGEQYFRRLGLEGSALTIGTNFTSETFVRRESPDLLARSAQVLDALVDQYDANIVFFCNEVRPTDGFDKVANDEVRALMTHREATYVVTNEYWTPSQMQSLIGMCNYTIGMRYHFCVFSALQGVPFIAIERTEKVGDLCWQLEWPYGVSFGDLTTTRVLGIFSEMMARGTELLEALESRVHRMRDQAGLNSTALDAMSSESGS